jgi:outer membrane scaffolding protein for murein synthesis (MipA/OmpV family)
MAAGANVTFSGIEHDAGEQPWAPFSLAQQEWQVYSIALQRSPGAFEVRGDVLANSPWSLGPVLGYRPDRVIVSTERLDETRGAYPSRSFGGQVGYDLALGSDPRHALGLHVQVTGDPSSSSQGWLFQPGLDYRSPIGSSWSLSGRLFSTYASDYDSGRAFGSAQSSSGLSAADRFSGDAGFKDIGVGLGLDYSLTQNWLIQGQAGYSRLVGDAAAEAEDPRSVNQFFGGVIVNYKF